jgi:hypothetical protein
MISERKVTAFACAGILLLAVAAFFTAEGGDGKATGVVHVLVFEDDNLDGVINVSETRAAGEVVQIYQVDGDGRRILLQTAKTDENGEHVFSQLPCGKYVVDFVFSTGVTIETLPFTVCENEIFVRPAPVLPRDRRVKFSLLDLGFRNPANVIGDQVSRFTTDP